MDKCGCLAVVMSIGLLVALVALVAESRKLAMMEAEYQAAFRLLGEFHAEYLRERNEPLNDYAIELEGLGCDYPQQRGIACYIGHILHGCESGEARKVSQGVEAPDEE